MALEVRNVPVSKYYSGQGQVLIGERDAKTGRPFNVYQVGNAPALEIAVQTTQVDHKESMSGQRATDKTIITEKSATLTLTLESFDLRNLAMSFYGETVDVAAGSVTGEKHVVSATGSIVILGNNQVKDVVVTQGSGAGTTVPVAAYVVDPDFGTLQFDPTYTPAITGEITVAYSYGKSSRLDALTQVAPPERFIRFQGINTVDDTLVLVEIPRAAFQPLASLPLINDEIAQVELTATILPDNLIVDGGSKYYRQTTLESTI